jgi:periplasmic mercuric ion binding protein
MMKEVVTFLAALLVVFAATVAQAKTDSATIKTTIQCSSCEKRIMKNLPFEKGVKDVKVDVDRQTVWVEYNAAKTDLKKIKEAIAKLGYDADDVKRDGKAYEKLPACCKENSGLGRH